MGYLRKRLIKLALDKPELQQSLMPLLQEKKSADLNFGNSEDLFSKIRSGTAQFLGYVKALRELADDLQALIESGEEGRLGRSERIKVKSLQFDGKKIVAQVQGETGKYKTMVKLKPGRAFNCTCPDKEKRGRQVGPCKHVIAVSREFWKTMLEPELENLETGMVELLEKRELLV